MPPGSSLSVRTDARIRPVIPSAFTPGMLLAEARSVLIVAPAGSGESGAAIAPVNRRG